MASYTEKPLAHKPTPVLIKDNVSEKTKASDQSQSRLFNPCACWSLKDGCIVIGIWTVICAALQLALFGWQTAVVRRERFRSSNSRASYYGALSIQDSRYPAYYEQYYQTPEERFYLQLFIIQIIHLITDLFLLGTGIAVIYGIQRRIRLILWPYFITVLLNIVANVAYCGIWLSSPPAASSAARLSTSFSVRDRVPYWAVLTAIALLISLINIYAFVVILAGYRHLQRGRLKSRGYFLESRPPSDTPKTSMVSLSQHDLANKTGMSETKIISDIQKCDPSLTAIHSGSLRKPMDPNLIHTMHAQQLPPISTGYHPYGGYGYPVQPQYPTPTSGIPPYSGLTNQPYLPPPQQAVPDIVPPYRAGAPPASGDVKQQFTELWLNGVQPGTGVDPAPIFVGPPTRSAFGGSQRSSQRRRRPHGSRSSLRSSRSHRRSHGKSRGSESDTSSRSGSDGDTRSRTSRASRSSARTCDSCRRSMRSKSDSRRRHRSSRNKTPSSENDSDTGYSDFTRSKKSAGRNRYSGSDSETIATSYMDGSRSSARRSHRSRRSHSDSERRHRPGRSSSHHRRGGGGGASTTHNTPQKLPAQPQTSNLAAAAGAASDGYTSAPTGLNEAKNRHPITGAAGGGARILSTPTKQPGGAFGGYNSSTSFSDNPTLPMGQSQQQRRTGATPPSPTHLATAGAPRYTIDSDVTIQYQHPSDGGGAGGGATQAPSSSSHNPRRPADGRPLGGVPMPGMTSGQQTHNRLPPLSSQQHALDPVDQSTGSSNVTRTYGTTAV